MNAVCKACLFLCFSMYQDACLALASMFSPCLACYSTFPGTTDYDSSYKYMVPGGYSSHKEYLGYLQMQAHYQLPDRTAEAPFNFKMEYLQGVDSRGYSYHHGNFKGLLTDTYNMAHLPTYHKPDRS